MTLDPRYTLMEAQLPRDFDLAGALFKEYAAQLGIDLCFQDFTSELRNLPGMYSPPSGCLCLVMRGQTAVGCGGVRRLSDGVCEMKRLYVQAGERGANLGRELAEYLVGRARTLGYKTMRLDTLEEMKPARTLYESLGFRPIESYYDNPLSGVVYMELDLI